MLVIDIPRYSKTSGGVKRMLRLMEQLYIKGYSVRLHISYHDSQLVPKLPFPATFGGYSAVSPKNTLITYSDNPRISEATSWFSRVLVYQLSFGMNFEREKAVVLHPKTTILCSTQKVFREVEKCVNNYYPEKLANIAKVGFALDEAGQNFYKTRIKRTVPVTILAHKAKFKNYPYTIALLNEIGIKPAIFGGLENTGEFGEVSEVYNKPSIEALRDLFNRTKVFLNLSTYEGLNMTPLEAGLCGAVPILNQGTLEIYTKKTCIHVSLKNKEKIQKTVKEAISNFESYNFEPALRKVIKRHTWDRVLKNIEVFLL